VARRQNNDDSEVPSMPCRFIR